MMPAESAHDTVEALGEVGLLQFRDLNKDKSAFQRTFANQVRWHCCSGQVYMSRMLKMSGQTFALIVAQSIVKL